MSDIDALARAYDAHRDRMVNVAYAIVGSRAEAEDVVADCWAKLVEADAREPVRDVPGWLTVAVARTAVDVLRSARVRRETYPGVWLPEPVVTAPDAADPADRVTLDETVGYALLVVLESLSPAERTAWVMHDVFGMRFDEVAVVVGRSPAAVRQLAARARAHLAAQSPRFDVDRAEHERVLGLFLEAAAGGDLQALVATLDPDVVLVSDGGGVVSAARRPVEGAVRVARFLLGVAQKNQRDLAEPRLELVEVNGLAAVAIHDGDRLDSVVVLTVDGGRVGRIDVVRAPDKLAGVARR
ncbi:MAG TPA: RNA polymerase sigma factor SigJ [Nocardioides sp.]|nr:RNA polymerase sigma factor SigJ [Nocardioides sp.]